MAHENSQGPLVQRSLPELFACIAQACQPVAGPRVLITALSLHLNAVLHIRRYNFFGRVDTEIGSHDKPVRCIEWLAQRGLIATGSWDGTLRLWDPRLRQVSPHFMHGLTVTVPKAVGPKIVAAHSKWLDLHVIMFEQGPGGSSEPTIRLPSPALKACWWAVQGQNGVGYIVLPGKVFSMAQTGTRLIVATSARRVQIYDLRKCVLPGSKLCPAIAWASIRE